MIDSADISVVMQGPMAHEGDDLFPLPKTITAVRAIRALLPASQIILSTWEGENTRFVDGVDELLLSQDPGAQGVKDGFIPNNLNRQIVSTHAGLMKVTRKYALKIRSDIVLTSLDFIRHFECGANRPKTEHCVFESRIACNNFSSRNPFSGSSAAYAYHPSDHVHFGLAGDVARLWSIPLQSIEEATWFDSHPRPVNLRLHETSRLAPEQYLWATCLELNGRPVDLVDFADRRPEVVSLSERYLDANFIFIPDSQYAFSFRKYQTYHHGCFEYIRRNSIRPLSRYRRVEIARSYLVALARLVRHSFR